MAQKNSRHFSFIGQNIKKIRQAKNISQSEFASLFNLARPSIGAYEEGRSEPKIDTLIEIAKYFNLSIDILLKRELSSADIFNLGLLNKKLDKVHSNDNQDKNRFVPLIMIENHINFIVHFNNQVHTNDFQHIEAINVKVSIAFEQQGAAMELFGQGIRNGDILFCRESKEFQIGKPMVIVTKDGLYTRNIQSETENKIMLTSTNPSYKSIQIEKQNIMGKYQIIGLYTEVFRLPTSIEKRIHNLEEEISRIKSN